MQKIKKYIMSLFIKKCDICQKPLLLEISGNVCENADCRRSDALRRYLNDVSREQKYKTDIYLI